MELPPILPVCHDIHVPLPEPKKSCATCTILSFFLFKECTSHFFKCLIICLVGHCLCFVLFCLLIKKFLNVMWLSYHNVCKHVRKFTQWLFHCFYKINFLGFIPSHFQIGHFALCYSYIIHHQSLPRLHIDLPLLIHL